MGRNSNVRQSDGAPIRMNTGIEEYLMPIASPRVRPLGSTHERYMAELRRSSGVRSCKTPGCQRVVWYEAKGLCGVCGRTPRRQEKRTTCSVCGEKPQRALRKGMCPAHYQADRRAALRAGEDA